MAVANSRISLCFCVLLCWLASAGPALAQGSRAMKLWVPDPESEFVEAADRAFLGEALRKQARRYLAFELLEDPSLELPRLRQKVGCKDQKTKCLVALGRAADGDLMVHSSLQKLPGRFMVRAQLINLRQGTLVAQAQGRAVAGREALGNALLVAWDKLLGPVFRRQVKVVANVEGAQVWLDGIPVGSTPFLASWEMWPGKHQISLVHPDFAPVAQSFRVAPQQKTVSLNLKMRFKGGLDDIPVVALVPPPAERSARPPKDGGAEKDEAIADEKGEEVSEASGGEGQDIPEDDEPPVVGRKLGGGLDAGGLDEDQAFLPTAEPAPVQPDALAEPESEGTVFYKTWWFWTAVGAVVVAGTVTGTVLAVGGGEDGIPAGQGRLSIDF